MRKELIIAIFFGIAVGVAIAFGFWRANTAMNSGESTLAQEITSKGEDASTEASQITISQPEENDVLTSTPVKVAGITKPDITLIISAENEDYIFKTAKDGSFEQEVDLVGGVNDIIIASSENDETSQSRILRVVYTTEFDQENTDE